MNQHMKFEVHGSTDSKHMIGAKFKISSSAVADERSRRDASRQTANFKTVT